MKSKSLRTQLMLNILGLTIVIFTATILYITIASRNNALKSATELSKSKANEANVIVRNYLEKPIETTLNLKNSFFTLRGAGVKNRTIYQNLLKEALVSNTNYLATWSMWERNMLDGSDDSYKSVYPYDVSGRFNFTYYKDKGKVVIEPGKDSMFDEDYYTIPKSNRVETIMEPYFYSYTGNEADNFYETSFVYPLIENEKVIGAIGIDIDLKELSETLKNIKLYGTGFGFLVSNEGLVAAYPDSKNINKNVNEIVKSGSIDINKIIANGETKNFEFKDASGINQFAFVTPVNIGKSPKPWSLVVLIPRNEVLAESTSLMFQIMLVGLIGLIILTIIIYLQANQIIKPIFGAVNIANTISQGNLTSDVEVDRSDEIGTLQGALKSMQDRLTSMVYEFQNTSSNIADTSSQLNATAQQISSGASELASSTEELSSTMEEMVSNIEQSSQNSLEVEKIASQVADDATKVKEASEESMTSIKNIAEKIQIINDIAFQTNLLALNAAVEAARAGEHGKGFAVVAAEVRRLAERSRDAAEEINQLSTASVNITDKATSLLNVIIPKIQKTSELILEISHSNKEQRDGSEQVNLTTQQLNSITQQNASVSEEMASSAEEMASQAELLLEIASSFKTKSKDINQHTQNSRSLKKTVKQSDEAINKVKEDILIKEDKEVKPKKESSHSKTKPTAKPPQKGFDLKLKPDTDDNYEKF